MLETTKCSETHSKWELFCLICEAPMGRRQSPARGGAGGRPGRTLPHTRDRPRVYQ